jgi:hypothetical protein
LTAGRLMMRSDPQREASEKAIECRCPYCDNEMRTRPALFCQPCGARFRACRECGEPVGEEATACPSCGTSLPPFKTGEPGSTER